MKTFSFHPKNPKLALLIGRSSTPELAAEFDHASRTFPVPKVEVITYDEVLERHSLHIASQWEWITRITYPIKGRESGLRRELRAVLEAREAVDTNKKDFLSMERQQ